MTFQKRHFLIIFSDMSKKGSIRELLKTGTICTMVGAVGGGVVTYRAENLESGEYLRDAYQQVQELQKQVFEAQSGCFPALDSLNSLFLRYKFHSDSLRQELEAAYNLLDHTQDSLNSYKKWAEDKIEILEQNKISLKDYAERKASLESDLDSVQQSLDQCENRDIGNQRMLEQNNRTIEACDEERQKLSSSLNDARQSLATEENEVRIRDNQIDSLENMLEKHKNRYDIETEFSMLTTCVFGHGQNMNKYQYERQAKCCVKQIRQIQKKYPTDSDLQKISENFEIKNLCDSNDFY